MKKLSLLKLGKSPTNNVCTLYSYTVTRPFSAQDHPQKVEKTQEAFIYRSSSHQDAHRQERHKYSNAWMVLPPASGDA